jgi:hypothetical protein
VADDEPRKHSRHLGGGMSKRESEAIAFICNAIAMLEGARNDAEHGGYEQAIQTVRDARNTLTSSELKLRAARDGR